MKTIAIITVITLKQNFRDYKGLVLMLLLPVLLTMILGTALSKTGSTTNTTDRLHVHAALVEQDKSQASEHLAAFYQSPSIRKILGVKKYSSIAMNFFR
ncbi:MAG: hypothetical protein ACE3JK_12485 [Sporolactobacillus sp.]